MVYIDCTCNPFSSLCMTCTLTIRLLVILQYLRKTYNSEKEVINIIRSLNADICLIYREKSDTCITSTIEAFLYFRNYLNLFATFKKTLKRLILVLQDIKGHT